MTETPQIDAERYAALPTFAMPAHKQQELGLPRYLITVPPKVVALGGREVGGTESRVVWVVDDASIDDPANDENLQQSMEEEIRRLDSRS